MSKSGRMILAGLFLEFGGHLREVVDDFFGGLGFEVVGARPGGVTAELEVARGLDGGEHVGDAGQAEMTKLFHRAAIDALAIDQVVAPGVGVEQRVERVRARVRGLFRVGLALVFCCERPHAPAGHHVV